MGENYSAEKIIEILKSDINNYNEILEDIVTLIHETLKENNSQFNLNDILCNRYNELEQDKKNELEEKFKIHISKNISGIIINPDKNEKRYTLTCGYEKNDDIIDKLLENSIVEIKKIIRDASCDSIVMGKAMDNIIEVVHRKFPLNKDFKVSEIFGNRWCDIGGLNKEFGDAFKYRVVKKIDGIERIEKDKGINKYKLINKRYYFK